MSEVIGYARVSSRDQNLDLQIENLQKYGCDIIFQEKLSGTQQHRKELDACLQYVRAGDKLVVTRLDRIARSSFHLGQIIEILRKKNVDFVLLDQNIDTSSTYGALMIQMLGAFAEFENNIRKERQLEGIELAKRQGKNFGRPRSITDDIICRVKKAISDGTQSSAIIKSMQISKTTFYRIRSSFYSS